MKEACEYVRNGDDQLTGFWVRTFMMRIFGVTKYTSPNITSSEKNIEAVSF